MMSSPPESVEADKFVKTTKTPKKNKVQKSKTKNEQDSEMAEDSIKDMLNV